MTFRLTLIALSLLTCSWNASAQTLRAFIKAAEEAKAEKDIYSTFNYYQTASNIAEKRMDLRYAYADAAREYHAYALADSLYLEVIESKDSEEYPMAPFWIAHVKQIRGQYMQAIDYYQQYLTAQEGADPYFTSLANDRIAACRWAMENLRASDGSRTVSKMGAQINTTFSEVAALMDESDLYYASQQFYKKRNRKDKTPYPDLPFSRVMKSANEGPGILLDSTIAGFNDPEGHTAHLTFNHDFTRVYYNVCAYINKSDIQCDLYYRDIQDSITWGDPQKLPEPINLSGYTSTHPNVVWDEGRQREVLYFVSDRIGGKGKTDIWFSVITDPDNLTIPQPLNEVNTAESEISPFFHDESGMLYFSSNGRPGFGGYDVYKVEKTENGWGEVQNLGSDINSSFNDAFYTLNGDESIGYLSSNRIGSFYLDQEDEACCYDIYKVTAEPIEVKLIVETYNKRTLEPLEAVDLEIERKNGEYALETFNTGFSNTLTTSLKRHKNYMIAASKEGFEPDVARFNTYRITESVDIVQKMYLDPSYVVLEVRTFDKRRGNPLNDVRVSVDNLETDERQVNREEFAAVTYFNVQPGSSYFIEGTKKGYLKANANLDASEFDGRDTIVKNLYLELGSLEDFLPLAIYFDNDEPKVGTSQTTTNVRYLETFEPYYDRKPVFKRRYSRGLTGAEEREAEEAVERFFEDSLRRRKVDFESFLNILHQYLEEGLEFKIYLKGYASPIATDVYNYNLGQRRISTIQNEFKAFRNGVLMQYFQSGDLEVEEKSFGEEEAPPYVSDSRADLRRSVYSPEASIERRVEIIEIVKDNPEQ